MKYYLIIAPDEDGSPAHIVNEKEFAGILEERADDTPMAFEEYQKRRDPNYWDDDEWFAARIIPINIQPAEVVTKLQIVSEGE